ncbi:alanine racemase [Planktotalea sp.]|uniref:alanine racemase n=1 Tax=Planktotalea sp. TaxID=2029877 RepID=UPI003D6B3E30
MSTGTLTIDLAAMAKNWTALDAMSQAETGAVVKADAYGTGIGRAARRLAQTGARKFFVAVAEEAADIRHALGPDPEIFILSGHMSGDTDMISDLNLIPLLSSIDQMLRHFEALPGAAFGIQLDTGMNRLGMEPAEWEAVRTLVIPQAPKLIMSHLACADEPEHPMNAQQLAAFTQMTDGIDAPRSLAATGGILLGPEYHFDVTRPGIGLYGGLPFIDAVPVVSIDLPIIQTRDVATGESVGYGNTWIAERPSRIATVSCGYADGIIRAMGPNTELFAAGTRVPIAGRISMDSIGVDVTDAKDLPSSLQLLGQHQSVDTLAANAGTIGYEILTSLGARYTRRYIG